MKHFALAFCIALVAYAGIYSLLQYSRSRKGPWQVAFTNHVSGAPSIVVNQPRLGITNVAITFPDEKVNTGDFTTIYFDAARPVPFAVPFGRCVFVDNTFLPGSVTFQLFSNQVELLPRSLIINARKYPWPSAGGTIQVTSEEHLEQNQGQ